MFNETEFKKVIREALEIQIVIRDTEGNWIDCISKTYIPPIGSIIKDIKIKHKYFDVIVQQIFIEEDNCVDVYVSILEK